MTTPHPWQFDRIRYWQGQLLRSGDLNQQVTTDVALRQWHNRAMHHAYGVAFGFEITEIGNGHTVGFHIAPGVAHDCYGRPLLLPETRYIPVPAEPAGSSIVLVLRYAGRSVGPADPACDPACGQGHLGDLAAFSWVPAGAYTPGAGVGLLRVNYDSRGLGLPDPSFAMLLMPPEDRPYIAGGSTIAGATPWARWRLAPAGDEVGLETLVDTSAAGFTGTPCYLATMQGLDPVAQGLTPDTVLITHVEQPQSGQFLFRVLGETISQNDLRSRESQTSRPPAFPFFVRWIGCESRSERDSCLRPIRTRSCC